MPEKTALAEFVADNRHGMGESQFAYAFNCGISKETLSKIECGKANPSLGILQNIAAYAGVTVAEMLTVKERNEED